MPSGIFRNFCMTTNSRPHFSTNLSHPLLKLLDACTARDQIRLRPQIEKLLHREGESRSVRGKLELISSKIEQSRRKVEKRRQGSPLVSFPANLPVSNRVDDIVQLIHDHQVLVLSGETGSGKSTQIPKMCLSAGRGVKGKIGCTQPRRVAAQSLARRVAEELEVPFGREVGCKIRFQDESSPQSYIKFMTDGILLSELQNDPMLSEYDTLIIDEAHERSLNIDFILGHLRQMLKHRPDLKLIITSATIDTSSFARAFGDAPVIEVSGKLFPVEVVYKPFDDISESGGGRNYVDAAIEIINQILHDSHTGDVLVFMPSERDIRECLDTLVKKRRSGVEFIPLFGRLAGTDQQKVFQTAVQRRVIVATNIAETSLTLPGIRYVVDTGLARVSRYSPGTHTRRLPIEPIAQSNANQRKGRCGRVAEGVCYRLFSESDFKDRAAFLSPEIQRCNLAEVILKMKAFSLGDIETFPFIQPPKPAAVRSGYQLLKELGALDDLNDLTSLGQELARLPMDPTLGRMIIEAEHESVLEEVVVIGAGLSIQDPRERPMEFAHQADLAHQRFIHPKSDFLTLLNVWNVFHDEWERLKTQNQLRKFCRAHFLSYMRLREWRDIYQQIHSVLGEKRKQVKPLKETARSREEEQKWYASIHRCILSGLLSRSSRRKERNLFATASGRQVSIFPGSALFERQKSKDESKEGKSSKQGFKGQGEWVVSAEMIETSRNYARTNAVIQPAWIIKLGAHLCKYSYLNPRWHGPTGRVVCTEVVRFNGLEVIARQADFARSNPDAAREIMILEGLVKERDAMTLPFSESNNRLIQSVEERLTRVRHGSFMMLDDLLYDFYAKKLPQEVTSIPALQHHLRRRPEDLESLIIREEDLLLDEVVRQDAGGFPGKVGFAGHEITVEYAYAPGEQHDGVTLVMLPEVAERLSDWELPWLIPGHREALVLQLLKSLSKSQRRVLMPVQERARAAVAALSECGCKDYLDRLIRWLRDRFDIQVSKADWDIGVLPDHIRPRVRVLNHRGKKVYEGKRLQRVEEAVKAHRKEVHRETWEDACRKWEKHDISTWSFGDLPEQVLVGKQGQHALYAYPGLHVKDAVLSVRLFPSIADARAATKLGWSAICARQFERELSWWQKDLASGKVLTVARTYYVSMGSLEEFTADAYSNLISYLFECPELLPLKKLHFDKTIQQARARIMGFWQEAVDLFNKTLEIKHQLEMDPKPYSGLAADLASLFPSRWLLHVPFSQLKFYPKYLKAMQVRSERARSNAVKDREKSARLQPWINQLNESYHRLTAEDPRWRKWSQLRWMLEDYKVSLFAQELGTPRPASEKRMKKLLEEIK